VELGSKKQYVQPQPLVPATVPVEEYPPQAQLIKITTEINNNGDSFEENKVEGNIRKKLLGEIFMEGDEKEKSCLSTIYVDFSKYLSPEEPRVTYCKENSRTSFFQVGVSDVGWNLIIFSVQTKIEEMPKIILKQSRLIKSLPVRRQWKYKRKELIVKPRVYFIFISLLELRLYFLYLLGLDLFYLFLFLLE